MTTSVVTTELETNGVIQWLLMGDAAIRWQTLRDLQGATEPTVRREQRRVGEEGWGARLLAMQDPDGRWASGIYTPKWTSTTYTMVLLRSFGLQAKHPQAIRACQVLMDMGFWNDGGINFGTRYHKRSETCVSSMVLAVTCWFRFEDARVDQLAEHVIAQQMADGGWNCRAMPGYGKAFQRWKRCWSTSTSARRKRTRRRRLRREGASSYSPIDCSVRIGRGE